MKVILLLSALAASAFAQSTWVHIILINIIVSQLVLDLANNRLTSQNCITDPAFPYGACRYDGVPSTDVVCTKVSKLICSLLSLGPKFTTTGN